MNHEQARELFSELHEGTLSGALKQKAERYVAENPDLAAEFDAFREVYASVSSLPPVEAPADLHERISRSLDKAIWDQKKSAPSRTNWMKLFVYGAAAACVGVVALLGIAKFSGDGTISAGPGIELRKQEPTVIMVGREVRLKYKANGPISFEIFADGKDRTQVPPADAKQLRIEKLLALEELNVPLLSTGDKSGVIWAKFGDNVFAVILPGQVQVDELGSFNGRLIDGLKLVSDKFGIPIQVFAGSIELLSGRDLRGKDIKATLENLLEGTGLHATEQNGVIVVR